MLLKAQQQRQKQIQSELGLDPYQRFDALRGTAAGAYLMEQPQRTSQSAETYGTMNFQMGNMAPSISQQQQMAMAAGISQQQLNATRAVGARPSWGALGEYSMNQGIGSTIGAGISHDLALGGQGEIQGVDRDIVSGATSAFSTARASSALGLAEEELAPAPVAGAAGYVGADYGAKLGEAEYGASLGPGALAGAAIGTTLGVGAAVAGEVSKPEVRKTASGVDAVLLRLGVGAAVAGEVSKTEVEKAASGVDPAIAAKKDSINLAVRLPRWIPSARTKCGKRKRTEIFSQMKEYGASLGPEGALAGAAIGTALGVGAAVAGEVSKTEVEKAASGVDPAIAAKKDSFNLAVPLPGCHLAVPLPGCAKTKCGWRKYGKKQVRCEYILGCRNSFFIPHHLSSPPFRSNLKTIVLLYSGHTLNVRSLTAKRRKWRRSRQGRMIPRYGSLSSEIIITTLQRIVARSSHP